MIKFLVLKKYKAHIPIHKIGIIKYRFSLRLIEKMLKKIKVIIEEAKKAIIITISIKITLLIIVW